MVDGNHEEPAFVVAAEAARHTHALSAARRVYGHGAVAQPALHALRAERPKRTLMRGGVGGGRIRFLSSDAQVKKP